MPRKPTQSFVEVETDDDSDVIDEVSYEPQVVSNSGSDTVNARVKGTWKMFWGRDSYDFEDGKRYKLPRDLYGYLRQNGNIYDTL